MRDYASLTDSIRASVDAHAMSSLILPALAALRRSELRPRQVITGADARRMPDRVARVAVVIPCYNYAHYLEEAVRSVLTQQAVDPQVVVVNDCSSDNTAEVADQLAAGDPRVEVIHNVTNLGHVRAFNAGLARVEAEFLVRLDADDLLAPGSLARAVALFDHAPDLGLVYGHPHHFETQSPPAPRVGGKISWTIWPGTDWLAERCRRGVNCITTPEAMVRMSIVHQVGPLDTRLRFAQDMEMWCRVAATSDVGRIRGVDQALHRDHAGSMSATDGSPAIVDLQERRQVFASVFEGPGSMLPNAPALHSVARMVLAREAVGYAEKELDGDSPGTAQSFLEFAQETAPAVLESGWPAAVANRARGGGTGSPLRLLRRRLAGVGRELDFIRWTVHGV